jgi:hypothetical protein
MKETYLETGPDQPLVSAEFNNTDRRPLSREIFSQEEIDDLGHTYERLSYIENVAKKQPLFSGNDETSYLKDCEEVEAEREGSIAMIVRVIRDRMDESELSRFIVPEDAEVIGYRHERLVPRELHPKYDEAIKRRYEFVQRLNDATNNSIRLDSFSVYSQLLLESADQTTREKYYEVRKLDIPRESFSKRESFTVSDDYFDPSDELKRVTAFSEDERQELSQEEYIWEKRRRLESFKERLIQQLLGMTALNIELEDLLSEDGKYDDRRERALEQLIENASRELKLSPIQLRRYRRFMTLLGATNKRMDAYEKTYRPGSNFYWDPATPNDIFKKFFGRYPNRTVQIERRSVMFFVKCHDDSDYLTAYAGKNGKSDEMKNKAYSSGGFSRGIVSVGRCAGSSPEDIKRTRRHEERHSLKSILDMLQDQSTYESLDTSDRRRLEEGHMALIATHTRRQVDEWAKNEIFAYMKDGRSFEDMQDLLLKNESNGGLYDYLEENRKEYHKDKKIPVDPSIIDAAIDREQMIHRANVVEAIDIAERLEYLGKTREEILSLFEFEQLEKWGRHVTRIEQAGQLSGLRKKAIEAYPERLQSIQDELNRKELAYQAAKFDLAQLHDDRFRIIDVVREEYEKAKKKQIHVKAMLAKISEPFH